MTVNMNNSRLQKALLAIITKVGVEYEAGYGGACIELETLHTKIRNGRRSIEPYTPEEMAIIVERTVRMMEPNYTVKYYGSHIYLPEGGEVFHNAKGARVGHLLVINKN